MAKIVAMIPARLGSKRIKHKNLRLLAGKPLVCHVAESAKKSGVFDDIYINSETDIFSQIAKELGIKFYKRKGSLSTDDATNDMFVLDFIENVECDIIIQINPTSPLISAGDIKRFVKEMVEKGYDTLHSVKKEQIEALFRGKALNFDPLNPMPRSQDLTPIFLFSSGIMGWRTKKYFKNIKKFNSATYGGDGKIGYFVLAGFSTIDIDNEEDFRLAEIALDYIKNKKVADIKYYGDIESKKIHTEVDVLSILKKDGIKDNDLFDSNKPLVNIGDIIKNLGYSRSWSKRIINTENNSATLICQVPGEGNRLHYHPDWNEWWYIVKGTWKWEIEGKEFVVKKGDIVFIEKNKRHKVTAIGDRPAIRLAVSRQDVTHIYPKKIGKDSDC